MPGTLCIVDQLSIRRLITAAVALCVWSCCQSAYATCGDYLAHPAEGADPALLGEETPQRQQPCDGPHCRQAPSTPPVPAAPVLIPVGPQDCALAGDHTDANRECSWREQRGNAAPRAGFPRSIDRPPRLG